jgi:uncharacterized Fe-S center protein
MKSKVHFLTWDRRDEFSPFLKRAGVFEHIKSSNFLALKIHFGEKGNTGYISPNFIKQIVKIARDKTAFPFLTDSNTLYVGKRADAYHHLIIANKHGFSIDNCDCPVIIADGLRGNTQETIRVDLKHFKEVFIGREIALADKYIFLNHFKGHEMTGFGGALKNIGMGCGSRAGKYAMHNNSKPAFCIDKCIACGICIKYCAQQALSIINKKIFVDMNKCSGCGQCMVNCPQKVFSNNWNEGSKIVQEKIVEYAYGVMKGKQSSNVNFLNHISKYCDCFGSIKNEPLIEDIGIVASIDPVAADQASYDLVNEAFGGDFFKTIHPDIDATAQLEYAQEIGLGNREYELVRY